MTRKGVNVGTVNEFHDFALRCLPRYTTQDIDAQALVVAEPGAGFRVVALYEIKRSFIDPPAWRPFAADRPTYCALFNLARAAGVPLFVVYHRKGEAIEEGTALHVFLFKSVAPEYHGVHEVITGREFARRYPYPLGVHA